MIIFIKLSHIISPTPSLILVKHSPKPHPTVETDHFIPEGIPDDNQIQKVVHHMRLVLNEIVLERSSNYSPFIEWKLFLLYCFMSTVCTLEIWSLLALFHGVRGAVLELPLNDSDLCLQGPRIPLWQVHFEKVPFFSPYLDEED